MALSSIAIVILGPFIFWLFSYAFCTYFYPPPPGLRNKRILLLIGHPDDEAMFFGPAVLALTSPSSGNQVKILCLSTGNAVGQGEIRKGELLDSARRLGIRHDDDVHTVDDPRFQDGPGNDWKQEEIADFLSQVLVSGTTTTTTSPSPSSTTPELRHRQYQQRPSNAPQSLPYPDVILTFDPYGVSLHPNHSACHYGSIHFLRTKSSTTTNDPKPSLYTLTSLPTLRKYISIFDMPLTFLLNTSVTKNSSLRSSFNTRTDNTSGKGSDSDNVIFISHPFNYLKAFGAMVSAHKTQMLWFRWGWIILGRYMVINDLKRVDVEGEVKSED